MTPRRKFINAVFNCDAESFKRLLETESFDEALLTDTRLFDEARFPIYWITQCLEIVLAADDWSAEYVDAVIEKKKEKQ